ncbi:MAG: hypothetical protein WDM92_07285 [Caulobacteraceae bacterium]
MTDARFPWIVLIPRPGPRARAGAPETNGDRPPADGGDRRAGAPCAPSAPRSAGRWRS